MTQKFKIILHIKGPDATWDFKVPEGRTVAGRQVGNDLLLDNSQISRQHAQFDCTSSECKITDLGSSNGTRVNGEKLTSNVPALLRANDIIKIGPFILTVEQVPIETPKAATKQPAKKQPKPAIKEVSLGAEPLPAKAVEKPPQKAKTPAKSTRKPTAAAPPPKKPLPPPKPAFDDDGLIPPGLSIYSSKLIKFLPDIYHTDFMSRFLGMFEAILTPIEWNIDNFDLYLAPGTAPVEFLRWLSNWYEITFDITWREDQRRQLLAEAHQIYARRGTRWALSRVLEIYTGHTPEIIDQSDDLEPFTFSVKIPISKRKANQELIESIIDANKPAHTTYTLKFGRI